MSLTILYISLKGGICESLAESDLVSGSGGEAGGLIISCPKGPCLLAFL